MDYEHGEPGGQLTIQAEQDEARKARCADCGLLYSKMPLDFHVPHSQWCDIAGEDSILCANCLLIRASMIQGVTVAHIIFENSLPR